MLDAWANMQYNACNKMHMTTTIPEFVAIAKAVSNPLAVRMLKLLLRGEELCVCEIMDAVQVPQYTCSRSLGTMYRAKMVVRRREGRWAYYTLRPNPSAPVSAALDTVAHQVSDAIFEQDQARLVERLAKRVDGKCVAAY